MNRDRFDEILDRAVERIRDDAMEPTAENAAADRVWQRLSEELSRRESAEGRSHEIRDCSDFQALIPAYLREGLNDAKRLLLEDHVSECLPCRKMLKQERTARRRPRVDNVPAARRSAVSTWAWRAAAAAIVLIALIGLSVQTDLFTLRTGGLIRIEQAQGDVYRVGPDGTQAVQAGDEVRLDASTRLRTGKDARLVMRMADDSRVELDQQAELTVHERRKIWQRERQDSVIDLERGNIIVEASDQGSGHLYVDTADALVAVTGTVFAVNNGTKGSRVSVIEGEVHVDHDGMTDILYPGDQTTSSPALTRVPIADDIAWSPEAARHLALLAQMADLARELEARVEMPGTRYATDLLDLMPADTAVYVGMPNFSDALGQAYDILQERVSSNDIVRQWWDESVVATGADGEIEEAMDRIRSYGSLLGPEIAIGVRSDATGDDGDLLILAALDDEPAFVELLKQDLQNLQGTDAADSGESLVLLDRGFNVVAGHGDGGATDLYLWTDGDLLAVAHRLSALQALAARRAGSAPEADDSFHRQLRGRYDEGVEWLVGVDIERLTSGGDTPAGDATLEGLGIADLQHVIVELEDQHDRTESRATIGFARPRRGVASWLAEPAPMGSMRFISPNAYFAAGFVMKEPSAAVDELLQVIGSGDSDFAQALERFEREQGIDVRQDIAAAIGNEFVFAIDGPVLPKPSWKFVVEVNDPARLQATLEWAAARINEHAAEAGLQGVTIETSEQRGRVYHALRSTDTGLAAHYMFVDGYLVASASRALLDRALQYRDSGLTLVDSPGFRALLPVDSQVNFSGFMYTDLGRMLGSVGDQIAQISPDSQQLFRQIGLTGGANLTLAYGEPSQITFVNTSEGGLIRSTLATFLNLRGLMDVQELVGQATGGSSRASSRGDVVPGPDARLAS